MFKALKLVMVGAAFSLASISASAGWVDTINEPGLFGTKINAGQTVTRTHDIRDEGFVPLTTLVTDATLSFLLSDDLVDSRVRGGSDCGIFFCYEEEWAKFGVGVFNLNLGSFEIDLLETKTFLFTLDGGLADLAVLTDIWWDGQLKYSIKATEGDFYFLGSKLAVNVPEPGGLALIGLGLAGLALVRRREKKQ